MAPVLILLGAACVGVLVEACVPRRARQRVQFLLAVLALLGALVALAVFAAKGPRALTADTALAIDGPTLFLQGTLAVLGLIALLLMGERGLEVGGPFVAQAAI